MLQISCNNAYDLIDVNDLTSNPNNIISHLFIIKSIKTELN